MVARGNWNPAIGNDRFMNMASPGYTSETSEPEGGVWWPLRLNDMETDCAIVVALLSHEVQKAYGEIRNLDYRRTEYLKFPHKTVRVSYHEEYVRLSDEEIAEDLAEMDVRGEIARTRYDYLRELLEAAYVC